MKSTDFFIPLNKIASMKIRYQPNQDFDSIIGVGDAVKDMELSSLQHFLKELESI